MNYELYEIDKAAGIPVSRQIAELVLKNIEARTLACGDKLPPERELAQRLGIARGTVKAAYRLLERQGAVVSRQGSGSFIAKDEGIAEKLRRQKEKDRLAESAAALLSLGVPASGIRLLLDKSLSSRTFAEIAVISGVSELLCRFKAQLSEISGASVSAFSLDSVTLSSDAASLFSSFDVIVVPTPDYGTALGRLSGLSDKLAEAAVATAPETVAALAPLPRDATFAVICRTDAFPAIVADTLSTFGFNTEKLTRVFAGSEDASVLASADVIIACPGAEILSYDIPLKNEKKLIEFRCIIERGSVIYIENKLRGLIGGY